MLSEKWCIKLLNGLEVTGSGERIERFRGRTSAELLALLVLRSHRFVAREEIAGTIWPDSTPEAGRAGLRTALASLRAQLELPGTVANSVLHADRIGVRLSADAFTADVLDFKASSALADSARSSENRLAAALKAVELYTGELLPGNYSEWVLAEREKLHHAYRKCLSDIVSCYRSAGQSSLATPYAQRLVDEDPYDEAACLVTMRLCLDTGRPEDALNCFDRLKRSLQVEFETTPAATARELERLARRMSANNLTSDIRRSSSGASASTSTAQSNNGGIDDGLSAGTHELPAPRAIGLPIPLTRFFGRDTDIMHIVRMICPDSKAGIHNLAPQRLFTLTGTGGTGKTRLATEIGAILNVQRQIPVTFVPLADTNDPDRILDAVARALKLAVNDADSLFDRIVVALSTKPHLLILDNLEQLLAPRALPESEIHKTTAESVAEGIAVETVRSLLEHAPGLCCLVTSRQSLGIEG